MHHMTLKKIRPQINKALHGMGNFHNSIPLDEAFTILEDHGLTPIQEDGTRWSGLICGNEGNSTINLADKDGKVVDSVLAFSWYRLPSGRYEFVSYVS